MAKTKTEEVEVVVPEAETPPTEQSVVVPPGGNEPGVLPPSLQ